MYSTRTGLILGFHGCDRSVLEKVINDKSELSSSKNTYDWLGNGIYFWEYSPKRALEYISDPKVAKKNKIKNPAILGAVIDLGFCLDLIEYENIQLLKSRYDLLKDTYLSSGLALPVNRPLRHTADLLIRELDCAVIEALHQARVEARLPAFDSVRGVFWEGKELYQDAGFKEKNHIQICIRNPNCIKGYFLPRHLNDKFPTV